MIRDIQNRKDIVILVHVFYNKVRTNELLGAIFNAHISDKMWPTHLDKLIDFWETNLFGVPKFKGSPTQKHIHVDTNLDHTITQHHFDTWLVLWMETLDELFKGELAERAKRAAQNMAVSQFLAIYNHRIVS